MCKLSQCVPGFRIILAAPINNIVGMNKLTHTFPNLRVDEEHHTIVHKVASDRPLPATSILRIGVKVLVEYYKKYGKWPDSLEEIIYTITQKSKKNGPK